MDDESIIMIIDAIILLGLFPVAIWGKHIYYVSFFHINTFIIFMDFIVIFLCIVLVLRRCFGG